MTRWRPIALTAVLLLAAPAAGQGKLPYSGSEVFRFALHLKDLKPLSQPLDALRNPSTSMIVVIGRTDRLRLLIPSMDLREYLVEGGAILIATDSSNEVLVGSKRIVDQGWRQEFNIRVSGRHLTAPRNRCYQGLDGRPFVRPIPGPLGQEPSPYDILRDVPEDGDGAVATDLPSEMTLGPVPNGFVLNGLAGYRRGTRRIDDRVEPPTNYFAVSLRHNNLVGRLVVLADHSVIANGMMGFQRDDAAEKGYRLDNGNWQFTNRSIDWLKAGWAQPRTHCLFIEDGEIVNQFAVVRPPAPQPPIPDLPPEVLANIILNNMNGIIDEAQKQNFFNRMVESWFGFPLLVRMFLIVMTVLFLFACLRRLIAGRRKVEPGATATPAQAALLPRGGVLRQRTAAQIEVGNLFEAASRRVRDRFDVLGGRPVADGQMPPVLIAGDVHDAQPLRQTVGWLWAWGTASSPWPWPPASGTK